MTRQFNFEINGSLWLAPMAGTTDYAFRRLAKENGCDVTVTEMISTRALHYKDEKSFRLMETHDEPGIKGIQIFGSEPEVFKNVTKLYLNDTVFDFIDINMGCPAPKIIKNGDGSALMKNVSLAQKIVAAVKSVSVKPVTVKMRLGFDKINAVSFAKAIEAAGADLITVHGRTRSQMYMGTADWNEIANIREAVSVPLIGNGDIVTPETAAMRLNSSVCNGIMLGRGVQGKPWQFRRIKQKIAGSDVSPEPSYQVRINYIKMHMEYMQKIKPEFIVVLEMRKHIAWYLKGISGTHKLKTQINRAKTIKEVLNLLETGSF